MNLLPNLPALTRWLAQAGDAPAGGTGMGSMLLMYGLLLAGFYFLMIAPQRKKAKEHTQMLSQLKPGDAVLTGAGIYGTVTAFRGDRVVVKIADNTRVEMLKTAIQVKLVDDDKADAKA